MLKRKSTTGAAPAASATTRSKSSNKKVKAAPSKLSYEKTQEELELLVKEDVARQLAPKRPPPEPKLDPVKVRRTLENLRRPTAEETIPDYDRSIIKSCTSQKERPHASGRKVA